MFGRRILKEVDADGAGAGSSLTTEYVYDGQDILLALDDSGDVTNRYLHGPAVDQILADEQVGDEVLWPLADNLGSVRDLIDSDGNVENHLVYDAYGNVISETASAVDHIFGFTGRERDEESDLQYNRARYYDGQVGRWISEDPMGFMAGDGNLSRYVHNAPTYLVDPSGLVESEGEGVPVNGSLPVLQDRNDGLAGRLRELEDELDDLDNKYPGTDKESRKQRKIERGEILAEKRQLEKEARNVDTVGKEHKEMRKKAHNNPLEAQESFDKAHEKRRVPEFFNPQSTKDRATHHLTEIAREGAEKVADEAADSAKRLLKKGGAALPGLIGFGLTLVFIPGKIQAKGVIGGSADELLDQLPLVDTYKAAAEIALGRDLILDTEDRPSAEEIRRQFPGNVSPEAGKRRSDLERGGVRFPPW